MNDRYRIIDDVLPEYLIERIRKIASLEKWSVTLTAGEDDPHVSLAITFTEKEDTPLCELITMASNFIGEHAGKTEEDVLRIRLGLIFRDTDKSHKNSKHIDLPNFICTTALVYLYDSDGDTFFYDGDEVAFSVTPKRNRCIIFDGDIYHCSSTPAENQTRMTLNINFAGKPNFCQN